MSYKENKLRLIDVSGLGNSGRTAFADFFREIKSFHVHPNLFEFNLLRLPDGINDLHRSLCEDWSLIKCDFAIKRFSSLCESLSSNYSEILTDKFMIHFDEYINSIIDNTLYINGWYDSLYESNMKMKNLKSTLKKVGLLKFVRKSRKLVLKNLTEKKTEVFLSAGDEFIEKTITFLEKILLIMLQMDYIR